MDVNQIFRDIGMLVHEQGDVIGNCCSSLLCSFLILSVIYSHRLLVLYAFFILEDARTACMSMTHCKTFSSCFA